MATAPLLARLVAQKNVRGSLRAVLSGVVTPPRVLCARGRGTQYKLPWCSVGLYLSRLSGYSVYTHSLSRGSVALHLSRLLAKVTQYILPPFAGIRRIEKGGSVRYTFLAWFSVYSV